MYRYFNNLTSIELGYDNHYRSRACIARDPAPCGALGGNGSLTDDSTLPYCRTQSHKGPSDFPPLEQKESLRPPRLRKTRAPPI